MPTVPLKDSLKAMVERKLELATEMLEDAINALLAGDVDEGRLLFRQYINATIGFQELARRTGKADKTLMQMLSASGNPTVSNLFEIIHVCTKAEGVTISAHVVAQQHVPS
ncbi:transcriptional regulator [uncultured Roseibium sp.]|uniref:helix-turn-helix domain-containing transcriptional regulator n=1 Tax=uncultured Roseibium sp. TaxID=1936171 RepID=UPI00262C2599|nr:transcriptional regulator [uncultured Roseibium sp.]